MDQVTFDIELRNQFATALREYGVNHGVIHSAAGLAYARATNSLVGWCPVCQCNRPSLPEPALGSCAWCFNHLMVERKHEVD